MRTFSEPPRRLLGLSDVISTMTPGAEGTGRQSDCLYKPNNNGEKDSPASNCQVPGLYLLHKVDILKQVSGASLSPGEKLQWQASVLTHLKSFHSQRQMYIKRENSSNEEPAVRHTPTGDREAAMFT